MSGDQSQPGSVGQTEEYQARQWMAAFRRGDRDTFGKIVSDFDYRIAAYLLKRGLPAQQSGDLARDTLRAAWRRLRAGETPKELWPWLMTIADDLLISRSDHPGDKIPDGAADTGDTRSAGARSALDAFANADSAHAQQRVAWQYASDFVKFMETVAKDLPTELRTALSVLLAQIEPMSLDPGQHNDTIAMTAQQPVADRTAHGREALDMVQQIAGLHFMARPGVQDCAGFTACLMQADWEYRQFGPQLPPLREHVNTCTEGNCKQDHADATTLAGQLPTAILLLALDLWEHRRQLAEMFWAAEASASTEPSATAAAGQASAVSAAPVVTEAPRLAETASKLTSSLTSMTSSLATRFAQLPGIRRGVEALQQHPVLAQYLTRGVAGAVALAVAGGIVVGTFGLPGGSADTGPAPSSTTAAPTLGAGPGSPGAGPGSPDAGPGSAGINAGVPGSDANAPGTRPGTSDARPGALGDNAGASGAPGGNSGAPGGNPGDPEPPPSAAVDISFDATALSYPNFSISGMAERWDVRQVQTLRLLPGPYTIVTPGPTATRITVTQRGRVEYDPSLDGVLSGRNTATLVLRGVPINFDARASSSPTFSISMVRGGMNARQIQTLQLLPGPHTVVPTGQTGARFTVILAGRVEYDPSLDGRLGGRGTTTLIIR